MKPNFDAILHVALAKEQWARGAMDNASDFGSEDSRFESWRARFSIKLISYALI